LLIASSVLSFHPKHHGFFVPLLLAANAASKRLCFILSKKSSYVENTCHNLSKGSQSASVKSWEPVSEGKASARGLEGFC
jgi:hypothetical protein